MGRNGVAAGPGTLLFRESVGEMTRYNEKPREGICICIYIYDEKKCVPWPCSLFPCRGGFDCGQLSSAGSTFGFSIREINAGCPPSKFGVYDRMHEVRGVAVPQKSKHTRTIDADVKEYMGHCYYYCCLYTVPCKSSTDWLAEEEKKLYTSIVLQY